MANAIVTVKIMPESPDVDLEAVKVKAKEEFEKTLPIFTEMSCTMWFIQRLN